MQSKIINERTYYKRGTNTLILDPAGGDLYVKEWSGGWSSKTSWGEPGNTNNEFRWIVEDEKLKLQQIKNDGNWDGTEGIDFTTIQEFNKI